MAQALHDAELDWWITGQNEMHAGRTDDPQARLTQVALVMRCTPDGVMARPGSPTEGQSEIEWVKLDPDGAARLADGAINDQQISALTLRDPYWPDDFPKSDSTLAVKLTAGAVRNGYIKIPRLQVLFPENYLAADERAPSDIFKLILPTGDEIETCILSNRGRLKERFYGLFKRLEVKGGDLAFIQKKEDGRYQLTINQPPVPGLPAAAVNAQRSTPEGESTEMSKEPLNQILYGPPGTGKTYATIDRALAILDPGFYESCQNYPTAEVRAKLKERFDELTELGRVRFTTFHQSFSYEDFVEGIRATTSTEDSPGVDAQASLRYEVEPGVFLRLCTDARADKDLLSQGVRPSARVWKISIEEASSTGLTRDYCFAHDEARIGWPNVGDLRDANLDDPALNLGNKERQSLRNFSEEIVTCPLPPYQ